MNRNRAAAGTLLQMTMKSCIKSRESLGSRRKKLGILCFSWSYVNKGGKECVCTVLKLQVTLASHPKRTHDHLSRLHHHQEPIFRPGPVYYYGVKFRQATWQMDSLRVRSGSMERQWSLWFNIMVIRYLFSFCFSWIVGRGPLAVV